MTPANRWGRVGPRALTWMTIGSSEARLIKNHRPPSSGGRRFVDTTRRPYSAARLLHVACLPAPPDPELARLNRRACFGSTLLRTAASAFGQPTASMKRNLPPGVSPSRFCGPSGSRSHSDPDCPVGDPPLLALPVGDASLSLPPSLALSLAAASLCFTDGLAAVFLPAFGLAGSPQARWAIARPYFGTAVLGVGG